MKLLESSQPLSWGWVMFLMTVMVVAGMVAWWSWTQTGLGGLWYIPVGFIIMIAAFLIFRRTNHTPMHP